ncbi:hypothetical protein HRR83_002870 [Exophiala dermatitidis]|uniref:Uncharacterized protein n=2 Tax=Exophiala dermatitidis TaxID=5970 RepID=H6C1A3_EXODN|nr:uncharacterized protein HMPREF1120_05425 [Exophiala dermatitidis NIH/UT8656]KAJ4516726.1 hypothetical protein HRR75_003386 [Exophiala dermatitidis]EHY57386.1 hypothetical protein HMPREF1120_05425 [Exophiala dermatitidis NIH/UT8656]KAJ4520698.1 hypothetical protein HRR74_003699 [Exophiala dermatitidis]KAJ4521840.1 hypothetical protein HRR73_003039 [Exophiala dermatitidis]KAJ4537657.1 hypothetical protein HRR76_005647 [Exophiala dermatitidis]
MEIHSVLPEERARDPKGEPLPWGYRYADSARNTRQPEESGPFGRNRSVRTTGSRTPRARTGTTPVRQKENSAVADFGRLFAKEQAKEEEQQQQRTTIKAGGGDSTSTDNNTATARPPPPPIDLPEAVPTECLIYGYASKATEWKVLAKFEQIVAPGFICEDYPREDPNLYLMTSHSPRSSLPATQRNLSREAIRKSRIYNGGQHWIKVTFDSFQAAETACFYSPLEIDGCLVHCEMWHGRGPGADVAIPKGPLPLENTQQQEGSRKARTMSAATGAGSGKDSAVAGFERVLHTLPRSHTMPDVQYGQPSGNDEELSTLSSTTASSATATGTATDLLTPSSSSALRSRSAPQIPRSSQNQSQLGMTQQQQQQESQYMTHIKVKKAVLRPVSEALPPQPTLTERVLRSVPVVSWFMGSSSTAVAANKQGRPADIIGEGPLLKDDGSWDPANGWYWTFWHSVDNWLGTDFCGLKDD